MANLLQPLAIRERCQMRWTPTARRGVAAVEAAITLPLLILLVFGSIELANGIFLNQALSAAAYEGAREASRPGGTTAIAQERAGEVLISRGITNFAITIEPAVIETTMRGTQITATVQAPMNSLAAHTIGILGDRQSTQSVYMVRH